VRLYAGPEFDFEVQLVLKASEVPECQLGDQVLSPPRLGWNTWMRSRPFERDAEDAVIQAQEIRWVN
jgi:type VI secretion system protein ImpH